MALVWRYAGANAQADRLLAVLPLRLLPPAAAEDHHNSPAIIPAH